MLNSINVLVSVVIPCYNSSDTIGRAIKSVINQTHQNLEIIIVDDASDDRERTAKIISEFKDNRIVFLQHETNKNGSAARNTGIKIAKGEYIAFLDSDDEWNVDHIEKSNECNLMFLTESPILFCKSVIKTSNFKDLLLPIRGILPKEDVSEYLFCNDGFIQTSAFFIRADIIKKHLFNESLIRHQDYDLVLRLGHLGYTFICSDHTGVIIHWENNDLDKKGGTWMFSYEWAIKNKMYFTKNSLKCFILKNCVLRLFTSGSRWKGMKLFFMHCMKFYSLKEWYKIISIFLFKKIIITKI